MLLAYCDCSSNMQDMQPTRYLRLPLSFDVVRLHRDLANIAASEWIEHVNSEAYEGVWRCVPLRSVEGRSDHIMAILSDDYADTPILDRCPYFRRVIDSFVCEKSSVRLMSMAPGARIHIHRDHGAGFDDGLARLHIPITTAPEVLFTVDGEEAHFSAGHAWYLNADAPHAVRNGSALDRVHLMLDCVPNPWLQRLFSAAGFVAAPRPKYGDKSVNDNNVGEMIANLLAMDTETARKLAARLQRIRQAGE